MIDIIHSAYVCLLTFLSWSWFHWRNDYLKILVFSIPVLIVLLVLHVRALKNLSKKRRLYEIVWLVVMTGYTIYCVLSILKIM